VANSKVTIFEAWSRLGLPGSPRRSCHSPFREERSPSFSIFAEGTRFKDHATQKGGSVFDFVMEAAQCDFQTAAKIIRGWEGGPPFEWSGPVYKIEEKPRPVGAPDLSHLRSPTDSEIAMIASLRRLMPEAVSLAAERGLLWCGYMWGQHAWAIADRTGQSAILRRIDGCKWIQGQKAIYAPGSRGDIFIGVAESTSFPRIIVIEGGPDLLAAFQFILTTGLFDRRDDITVVCAVSTSSKFGTDAWRFRDKYIQIIGHNDEAGLKAVQKWRQQLLGARAFLTCTSVPSAGDLNDHLLQPDSFFIKC
jgi:CHC2 zinc finger